jgi:serine/threonine protein kinase/tetratricopeptide (TPR) repeat protein
MNPKMPENELVIDSAESLMTEAVDLFLEAVHRGEQPDVEQHALRFSQIADVLRTVLPALGLLGQGAVVPTSPLGQSNCDVESDGRLGDYRILREIGRGGMGVVYEAEQISLQRTVALKVLPFAAALDPKRLERFKTEAQSAARLHHANIVPVYAVGCERGVYYYAMQIIEGTSLAEVINQRRQLAQSKGAPDATSGTSMASRLATGTVVNTRISADEPSSISEENRFGGTTASGFQSTDVPIAADTKVFAQTASSTVHTADTRAFVQRVAEWGIQAADALEHAHSHDVVHRDIKPANLLVDHAGNLWMTDFGLARLLSDAGVTMTGDIVGTFRYMSPEQANGTKGVVDHRCDIYSLGATLYELVTLKPVFDGANREELFKQILQTDPIPARRHNKTIPTDLETILLKAMANEPHSRYSTAKDLADDLRRFIDCRPIRARRSTLVQCAAKWARRHTPIVASAVVVLFLAAMGLAINNVLIVREQARTRFAYEEVARKQAATAAALAAEEKQRKLAETNFQQARQMLEFFLKFSEEDLADEPELQDMRSKLLQASLKYYQDFIEQSGNDPPLQFELAKSHLHVARILHEIGSTPAAEAAIEQALRTQEALVRGRPDDVDLRDALFKMYRHLGVMRGRLQMKLVKIEKVQQHLQLTKDQVRAIDVIAEKQQSLYEAFRDSQHVDLSAMRERFQDDTEAAQRAIGDLLDSDQLHRLDQLVLQRRHTRAFTDPAVADTLQLTATQKATIRVIQNDRSRCSGRIHEVLTDGQKKKWQELIGEPFSWERGHWRRKGKLSEAT